LRAAFAILILLATTGCSSVPELAPLNSSAVVKRVTLAKSWSLGTSSVTALHWLSGDQGLQIGTLDGKTRWLGVDESEPGEEWTLSLGLPTCVWDGADETHGVADGGGRIWCKGCHAFHHIEFAPAVFGSACVSLESARVAAMEESCRLGVWRLPDLLKLDEIRMDSREACGLEFGEGGSVLWAGDGSRVRAICPNGKTFRVGTIHPAYGLARVVKPAFGNHYVAVGTSEGRVFVYSCEGEVMPLIASADFSNFREFAYSIKAIAPLPGTTILAVATTGGAVVRLWDFARNGVVREISLAKDEPVSALACNEDGSLLACGFRSGKVAVFKVEFEK
jgi:hypothetical protein